MSSAPRLQEPEQADPACGPYAVQRGLFAHFDHAGVNYAVYKNTDRVAEGLAGSRDLDLLVDPSTLPAMRSILLQFGGFRGYPHTLYDNAMPEREDWFVPIGGTRLLHLDIAHAVMAGPKFSKRYAAIMLGDLRIVRQEDGGITVPVVHPQDRARIALVRFAFGHQANGWPQTWVEADGALEAALTAAKVLPADVSETVFIVHANGAELPVLIRQQQGQFRIDTVTLAGLKRALRRAHGAGRFAPLLENTAHYSRKWGFAIWRRASKLLPGPAADKRRIMPGRIVALIGPDGVGKSTQARRLAAGFGRRLRCRSVYLGSNDGSWMKIRRLIGARRRKNDKAADARPRDPEKAVRQRGRAHATGSATWRLLMGIRRYLAVRRSLRLAAAGTLVITDRWPQSLAEGMLDGPSRSPPAQYRLAAAMWRLEKRIYRRLTCHTPTLAIHMEAPFSVSHERKPGDIERGNFERRLALMRRMRAGDPSVVVVDAALPADAVMQQLFETVCHHLGGA